MQPEGFKYLAFISYSRADNERNGREWADWMAKLIETFPLENTHRKVFLDRQTLPAGGDLSPMLEAHLAQSKFLILLCSPKSATSKWVGAEIEFFRKSRGVDFIVPVVLRGDNRDAAAVEHWISKSNTDVSERTYADFRTREKQRNHSELIEEGWTTIAAYRRHLAERHVGSKQEIEAWVAAYEDRHKVAKYSILSQLFGLTPQELERIETEYQGRTTIGRLKKIAWILIFVLLVSGVATWKSIASERKARDEQLKAERDRLVAERSLMMIGDAHESSTRMISEVIGSLRSNLPEDRQKELIADVRRIVDDGLDESIPPGSGNDNLHMRAVVMDSRAHLALNTGDASSATSLYHKALDLREELRRRDSRSMVYQHNLAVSHDNLGDCHLLAARAPGISPERASECLKLAEAEYRESIEISRVLVARPDAGNLWKHDLAVGLFKLGDTLANRDDEDLRMKATEVLVEGKTVAEGLAESDPDYPKWQAHLGLFCLRLGRIHALGAQDEEARRYFTRGKAIFSALKDKNMLIGQYADWLHEIEKGLEDLG